MSRPSFQFYPADWRNNAKLRRCSEAARGAWVDILCVLHDSDEYGVVRWPLADLTKAAGVKAKSIAELVEKSVLQGADEGHPGYGWRPFHAGKFGDEVRLVDNFDGPLWYSSRLVRDEHLRQNKGAKTRFTAENQPPSRRDGERHGDGSSTSSPSSHKEVSKNLLNGFVVGKNGDGGSVTILDPQERLNRFQAWLAKSLGPSGWEMVIAAADPKNPEHRAMLTRCKEQARKMGKGWPRQWANGEI